MGLLERRAARPGDRPARHRSCAPDQSDACLGGRPRRKVLHASPPQGRHRTAPHGRSWSHDAAHQRCTDRRAPGTPSPRGRALPDPPARESRESRAGAVGSVSPGSSAPTVGCHRVCRACGAVGRGSASPRHRLGEHPQQGPCAPRFGGAPTAL
jgi:hypothetical protein